MKYKALLLILIIGLFGIIGGLNAATVVPNEIQQPGTQPNEIGNLESPDKCDNCHGGYNSAVEPAFNWRGSMMANAGRDPIFWATMAIAEQDFDGSGDLCIRCHSTGGWYAGRSTPTDGSGLTAGDADGVDCDTCHKMTNPDNSEHLGVMNAPFIANNEQTPATGYYGSGMLSLWTGSEKLGPYSDTAARHQFTQSTFHRSEDYCGSCHDVSNPAVGDLAHNNGTQNTSDPVVASGVLGSPLDQKAAFNNQVFQYGIVERTFSEFKAGLISQTLVSDYADLPDDLQAGALEAAYNAAGGDYEDGTPRFFTCQTCHMRAVTGEGANKKGTPVRTDLPLHDMTGGNYWIPDAIIYQDSQGDLRLGGGLTATQIDALNAGKERARQQLDLAAALEVTGNNLKVTNLTGHKLISGYPEGRRMWLNINWYGAEGFIREDGAYGALDLQFDITGDGQNDTVQTILNLHDTNTKIYQAHYAMTQEWAEQLISLGYDPQLPLGYDRVDGSFTSRTLGDLAAQDPGTYQETFHFVLNNYVAEDNRIPPYGFSYEEARKRNALPVPANQYGAPGQGGEYNYWDDFTLNPPASATSATIDLLYQPTSWEYIQFLYLANDGSVPFLGDEGDNMLEAWLETGQAAPHVMASTTWSSGSEPPPTCEAPTPTMNNTVPGNQQVILTWTEVPADPAVTGYKLYYDQGGKAQPVADINSAPFNTYTDSGLTNGQTYCYKVTSYYDATCESGFSNILCATPQNQGQTTDPAGVDQMETGKLIGKGKNKQFTLTDLFAPGDGVIVRARVVDESGSPIANATVEITINGPEQTALNSNPSAADGWAEATWQTQKPNKRGQGGTTTGAYTATTTNVTASGYHWDLIATIASFTIE